MNLPKPEEIKTWPMSQLLTAHTQLIMLDALGQRKVAIDDFEDATPEELQALVTAIGEEIDERARPKY